MRMSRLLDHFRPRFSVRTLAIFVTLVCAYFGAWEATRRNVRPRENVASVNYGDNDNPVIVYSITVPMPFLIVRHERQLLPDWDTGSELRRGYYLWLFRKPLVRVFYVV